MNIFVSNDLGRFQAKGISRRGMMIGYSCPVDTARVATSLGWKDESDLERLILGTNCRLEEAGCHPWEDPVTGRQVSLSVLKRFSVTAGVLEARGWSAERIKQRFGSSTTDVCHVMVHAKVPGVAARLRRRF